MSLIPLRLSRRLRLFTSVAVVLLITIATITAQFAMFEEGLEGEIWELLQPDLDLPDDAVVGNWASGVAWLDQELIVVDNYSGKTSKFDSDLNFVDTSAADWQGAAGTPSAGWSPNETAAAKLELNGGPSRVDIVLVSDCFENSRILAFLPDGTHQFTIHFPDPPDGPAYTSCLNGIAMGPGAYFKLSGSGAAQILELVGDFAVAWPERLDLESGGALIYRGDGTPSTATFTLVGPVFEASQPNWQLTGGADETGDPSIPAVKAVTGITFDGAGNFFMVDSWTGRLHGYQNAVVGGEPAFVHRFAFGTPVDPDDESSTSIELPEAYGMTLWPSGLGDRLLITLPIENRAVVYRPFSIGGQLQGVNYLFKLDGLGAVSGLPHSSAFDASTGRVAISDSGNNSVKIFRTPAVAIFGLKVMQVVGDTEQPVSSVCRGDSFNVRFSITVPEGRSPVQRVRPVLLVDGSAPGVAPTPADDYQPNGDGEVGTFDNPFGVRNVITYSYALTAPDVAGAVQLTGSALAFSITVDEENNFVPVTDILAKSLELAVADCIGNQAPTVTSEIVSDPPTTFSGPNAAGWLKVEPVAPAPMVFKVRLTATDVDGGIRRITYQLNGVNATPAQTVEIDPLSDGSFPSTVTFDVPVIGAAEPRTLPGSTTVTFTAQDNDFRLSAPGSVLLRLDNSVPNICFTVPYDTAIFKSLNEHWWNGTVTVPVSTNDSQGPTPAFVAPLPAELQGNNLVFALEGSGQFATLIAQDHVGHTRTLSSNTPLDVCGAGRTGTNVNIDVTIPTIAADLAGGAAVYQPGQMLTLTATDPPAGTSPRVNDGFSGVRRIEYSYDGFATAPIITSGAIAMIELSQPVTIHYRSVDWAGNRSATASRTFNVTDDPPNAPICTGATANADLWPPNHQQVYVTVSGIVDPEGQPITVTFNSILQDEPTNSVGQGNTMQDGGIEQNGTRAWVRAERSGTNKVPGDGRVYLIGFTARDAGGLTCTGTVRVGVPHDQRGKSAVLSPGRWNALTGQLVTPP